MKALVFTLIDSDPSGAQWGGHTSFEDPNSAPDAKPRQSIEVRTIAYFADSARGLLSKEPPANR